MRAKYNSHKDMKAVGEKKKMYFFQSLEQSYKTHLFLAPATCTDSSHEIHCDI